MVASGKFLRAYCIAQIKRLTEQVAQLQKIIQQDDMKQMMMDFASTTQAELEAERGELQVCTQLARVICVDES